MAAKESYNLEEGMQKLGVSKTTFYEYVKSGTIEKYLPKGRQRGARYSAKDIDSLAATMKGAVIQYNEDKERTVFRAARPEDAQEMFELAESIMSRHGGYGIPAKSLLPFLSIPNSEIGHVLIRDGHIIGYFTIVPLKHEKIMQIMQRKIRVRELKPEEIAQFEPGEPIDCFIWEVISDPDKKHVGQYLIGQLLTFFHSLGKRGVDIQGIYSTATSREGINLSRRMGMQMMNLPEVIEPNWIPFEWKIQENKNWLTKNYIQALNSYKKRRSRMMQHMDAPASASDE